MNASEDGDIQRQIDDMSAQVTDNRENIVELQADVIEATARADETEQRLDDVDVQIEALSERGRIDHEMITQLQADGLLTTEHAVNMALALQSSRTIGAAVGIIMATRRVSEPVAFDMLKRASQNTNKKIRALAEEIVVTGDVASLPQVLARQN